MFYKNKTNTIYYKLGAIIFYMVLLLPSCKKEIIVNDVGKSFNYSPQEIAQGINLGNVYNTVNFAAFTDIVNYDSTWYIVFRAGTKHVGGLNGEIKILKSKDAITWTVEEIINNDSLDLRDPKFVLDTLSNILYFNYSGTKPGTKGILYEFITSYDELSKKWNYPRQLKYDSLNGSQFLFWRLTYSKGKTYSAAYHVPILGGYVNDDICLFDNVNDFTQYTAMGKLDLGNSPSEATIRFSETGDLYFLIRRETADVALGYSTSANYTNVKWLSNPLSVRLSSPNFLFYNDKLLISGRDQVDLKFKFFSYNLNTNKVEKTFVFPSGDETGYAGMSFNPANKDELFMSYYVIDGEESFIKLVRMDLKTFLQ